MNPRQRRIAADWEAIRGEYTGHPGIIVEPQGAFPPEEYRVTYRVPGLRVRDRQPVVADEHAVRIQLPLDYPRNPPYCTPITPIFHPNIKEYVCFGDYWAAGEQLADLVAKIGDMIQYRLYNPASPVDVVAARYATAHPELFPIGDVDLRAPEVEVHLGAASG